MCPGCRNKNNSNKNNLNSNINAKNNTTINQTATVIGDEIKKLVLEEIVSKYAEVERKSLEGLEKKIQQIVSDKVNEMYNRIETQAREHETQIKFLQTTIDKNNELHQRQTNQIMNEIGNLKESMKQIKGCQSNQQSSNSSASSYAAAVSGSLPRAAASNNSSVSSISDPVVSANQSQRKEKENSIVIRGVPSKQNEIEANKKNIKEKLVNEYNLLTNTTFELCEIRWIGHSSATNYSSIAIITLPQSHRSETLLKEKQNVMNALRKDNVYISPLLTKQQLKNRKQANKNKFFYHQQQQLTHLQTSVNPFMLYNQPQQYQYHYINPYTTITNPYSMLGHQQDEQGWEKQKRKPWPQQRVNQQKSNEEKLNH